MSAFFVNVNGSSLINKSFTIALQDDTWTHIVVTNDGTGTAAGVRLWLDAVEQTNTNVVSDNMAGSTAAANPMNIGNLFTGFPIFLWPGNIDEPAFFNIALSQSDINELYNEGKPTDISLHSKVIATPTANPLWLRMGDDSGDTNLVLVNQGSTGAPINGAGINLEPADLVDDVP